jgi:hypothetical protein
MYVIVDTESQQAKEAGVATLEFGSVGIDLVSKSRSHQNKLPMLRSIQESRLRLQFPSKAGAYMTHCL